MTISPRKAKTPYWRELGLVFIGAAIALSSSILTTHMQSNSQREQLILERKTQLISDYAKRFNENIFRQLVAIDEIQLSIDEILRASSTGSLPPDSTFDKLDKKLTSFSDLTSISAGISADRILLHVYFGDDAPDLTMDYNDPNRSLAIEMLVQDLRDAHNNQEQAEIITSFFETLKLDIEKLSDDIIEVSNISNEQLIELAKQIRP